MQAFVDEMLYVVGGYVPGALAALGVLVVGWLIALVVSGTIRALLQKTRLDERLAGWTGAPAPGEVGVERWIARVVYYLIVLFALIGFFQVLGLTAVTDPLNRLLSEIFGFAPRLLAAAALLLLAWVIAGLVRMTLLRLLAAAKLDERLGARAGVKTPPDVSVARSLAVAAYWLVFLLFLPAVLDALALSGVLDPVQGLVSKILLALPHVLAAGLILLAGWFFARIAQQVVANLLSAVGIDRGAEQTGVARVLGNQKVSNLGGMLVYILILIPTVIAALEALQAEAISRPASEVLRVVLSAIPAVFAALLVLVIAYVAGRLVYGLITPLLRGLGVDTWPARMGLGEAVPGQRTLSELIGYLVAVAIMLLAVVEAAGLLGFAGVSELVAQFLKVAGQAVVGLAVFGLGLYAAQLAAGAILSAGGRQGRLLAMAARVAIIVLASAMALSQMGIAGNIIELAFGFVVGAIALAAAVAFGIGGREIAARELERWVRTLRGDDESAS